MKEIKKYTDIVRYGKSYTENVLKKGDYITITEKIDGANASFRLDETNPLGVSCYSRNNFLTENLRLNGFYDWVIENIIPIKEKLNPNYIYYGEWSCPHKVKYKEEYTRKFFMFSIWDIELNQYVSDEIVKSEASILNLKTVPYFYEGEYVSFEHLMSFVGKSNLSLVQDNGEGIVVKNVDYFDKYGRQVFVKLVSEKFAEVQKQKLPKNPNVAEGLVSLVKATLTQARIEKMIFKLVDEELLKSDYTIEDMGLILKLLGSRIFEDIMKEESEYYIKYETHEIKRTIGKNLPPIVREIILNK